LFASAKVEARSICAREQADKKSRTKPSPNNPNQAETKHATFPEVVSICALALGQMALPQSSCTSRGIGDNEPSFAARRRKATVAFIKPLPVRITKRRQKWVGDIYNKHFHTKTDLARAVYDAQDAKPIRNST